MTISTLQALFLLSSLIPIHLSAIEQTPGHFARPPYPNTSVAVYIVKNGILEHSDGSTIIEKSLQRLVNEYDVHINQKSLAGYIIDLDQSEQEKKYEGIDLDALVDDPQFAPWFHNPVPESPESEIYTLSLWKYATTGEHDNGFKPKKITYAVAYTHIDHVFIPLKKFSSGLYYNPITNTSTDIGLESLLHEALHIWHFRNRQTVERLLRTNGGYYDRVALSESICPNFAEVSLRYDQQAICGHQNGETAMKTILTAAKWPQRYGSLTKRFAAWLKDSHGCSYHGREMNLQAKVFCLSENPDFDSSSRVKCVNSIS